MGRECIQHGGATIQKSGAKPRVALPGRMRLASQPGAQLLEGGAGVIAGRASPALALSMGHGRHGTCTSRWKDPRVLALTCIPSQWLWRRQEKQGCGKVICLLKAHPRPSQVTQEQCQLIARWGRQLGRKAGPGRAQRPQDGEGGSSGGARASIQMPALKPGRFKVQGPMLCDFLPQS